MSSMGTPQTNTRGSLRQSAAGTPNHIYDLVSLAYHAEKSDWACQQYIQDAQQVGENDLVQFFQQCQQVDRQRAQQAQQLLQQQVAGGSSH